MKKLLAIVFLLIPSVTFALPSTRYEQNILPFLDNTYEIGSTSPLRTWLRIYTQNASTTNLTVSALNAANCDVKSSTSGIFSCGTDATGAGGGGGADFGKTFELNAANSLGQISLSPTTTVGLLITSASSTFQGLFVKEATTTNATTTNFNVTGQLDVDGLTSALVQTGATGITAEYAGTSCTNQYVRSLSALGAATCATVVATDVDLADLTATDGTLTFSGAYDGQTARTIGLNLGNANTWTGLQTFSAGTLHTASSSIARLFVRYGTTTEATTSVLSVSGHTMFNTLNVSGAATLPGGVTITCTACITDANVADLAVGGDVTGTLSAIAVTDNSHLHDSTSISGIDISADTNLTGGVGLTLTGDDMACDTATSGVFGCLAAADWVTFNAKQNALGYGKTWDMNAANSTGNLSLAPTTTIGLLVTSASSTFQGLFARNATSTDATSTTLNVSGQVDFDGLTSALVQAGAGGILAEYTGTSCTNQFPRSLSALGVAICASVANTDLTNSTISGIALGSNLADLTATDGTLTFSGTYNGSTARTIGLNLANPNTWTGIQTINNLISTLSTSTHATTTGTQNVGALRINSQHFTNLLGTGLINTAGVLTPDCATITGGAGLCDGVDADSGAGTGSNWSFESQFAIRPTSTAVGILTTSSSTIDRLFVRFATTTEATTTNLHITSTGYLTIPQGDAPIMGTRGQVALDLSDNQFLIATSTNNDPIVIPSKSGLRFRVSSTSAPFFNGFSSAKLIGLPSEPDGYSAISITCSVWGGTSIVVNLTDAQDNDSNQITCGTATSTIAIQSNGTFTALEGANIETGTVTGTPNFLYVTITRIWVRE